MDKLVEIVKQEFQLRVIEESLHRIKRCLDLINESSLWYSPNSKSNSIGCLIQHLEGNVRQYIVSGIAKQKDVRDRDAEFEKNKRRTAADLYVLIENTLTEANQVVQQLEPEMFEKQVSIQGFKHTNLSAILHVVEHLSYHVGQITYITKAQMNVDTGYYEGLDLNIKGESS